MANNLNKIFASAYKDEVEKRLAIGQSPRSIASWLRTRGENISHATINEYKKKYFNLEAEMAKIVKEKQEETKVEIVEPDELEVIEVQQRQMIETERNQAIMKVKAINHIAVLYDNIQDMREYLETLKRYEPVVAAHAAKGLFQEIRATIESLEKIQSNQQQGDDSSVARMLSSLKRQKKEMEKI